jgi:hypothetical protein
MDYLLQFFAFLKSISQIAFQRSSRIWFFLYLLILSLIKSTFLFLLSVSSSLKKLSNLLKSLQDVSVFYHLHSLIQRIQSPLFPFSLWRKGNGSESWPSS